jgi:hypothetical protein
MMPALHASSSMDGPDYFMNSPFVNLVLSSPMISWCPILQCLCGSLPCVLLDGRFKSFHELPFYDFDPLLLANILVFSSTNTPDLLPHILLTMDGSDNFKNSLVHLYMNPTTVSPRAQIQWSRYDLLLCTFSSVGL